MASYSRYEHQTQQLNKWCNITTNFKKKTRLGHRLGLPLNSTRSEIANFQKGSQILYLLKYCVLCLMRPQIGPNVFFSVSILKRWYWGVLNCDRFFLNAESIVVRGPTRTSIFGTKLSGLKLNKIRWRSFLTMFYLITTGMTIR